MHPEYVNGAESLTDIDGVGVLCTHCFELSEPPWRPNNRQRCAKWFTSGNALPHALRMQTVAKVVSEYLAGNVP